MIASYTRLYFEAKHWHLFADHAADARAKLPRERGGRGLTKVFTKFCSNHEIFTTKIKTFANLERFTKFLCHENLELYGIPMVLTTCILNTSQTHLGKQCM